MNKKDEIVCVLDEVIQTLIKLQNTLLDSFKYGSEDAYKPAKFSIGEFVYAKSLKQLVMIEDIYFDSNDNEYRYQFHAESEVSDNDFYSTYPEKDLCKQGERDDY